MSKAAELAEAHWSYVRDVLKAHVVDNKTINTVKFHYITSFIHGYKHGVEDAESDQ